MFFFHATWPLTLLCIVLAVLWRSTAQSDWWGEESGWWDCPTSVWRMECQPRLH